MRTEFVFCECCCDSVPRNVVIRRAVLIIQFNFNEFHINWCVLLRASLHVRREEKLTRCHWMVYCTYNRLNMFGALLCPSSGGRDYMCFIAAYGLQCLVVGCRRSVQSSRLCVQKEGFCTTQVVQHPFSWTHSLLPCTWPPTTNNQALHTISGNNTHIV